MQYARRTCTPVYLDNEQGSKARQPPSMHRLMHYALLYISAQTLGCKNLQPNLQLGDKNEKRRKNYFFVNSGRHV